ncbi:M48 family metalloprotease [Aquabacterium sp. A7-Y]|uniref:M48 family metallopeptidase n=1 Tax=Aquabacterium sp. A7-Y TaxID=1349605 RepID=UPI00223E4645|nr:M48 family metallopeptidase [Aquabacterium sp. A7-Y]MCW7537347.1 M48 family metalloprotease [Aquabacterium sp. A7-Y]
MDVCKEPGGRLLPPLLAAAACAAAGFHQLMLLVPLALFLGLPVLWYRQTFLAVTAGLAFVILAWLVQPAARHRLRYLGRAEAAVLYAWVDRLSERLDAPRVQRIALSKELNAGALELHRGSSLRPTCRVLVLGLPLLAVLDEAALKAVVAHELGHFSRQHGRLGHWLYRTRAAWSAHLAPTETHDHAPWQRAAAAFARAFVPWFERHSLAHARACEFEADRCAARAVGAAAVGRALVQLERAAVRWNEEARVALTRWQLHQPQPLDRSLETLAARLRKPPADAAALDIRLRTARHDGSHPPLGERLRALQLDAASLDATLPPAAETAGPVLLGRHWDRLAAEHDSAWAREQAPRWALRHAALGVLAERREQLRHEGLLDLERLRLECIVGEPDEAEVLAEALAHRSDSDDPTPTFHLACNRIARHGNSAAVPQLLSCIESSAAWAAPVRAFLHDHADMAGLSDHERAANLQLLLKAEERRARAAATVLDAARRGSFMAARLDDTQKAALAAALAAWPAVSAAWCVGAVARMDDRRRYEACLLIVRVAPQPLSELGLDEDGASLELQDLLATLIEPALLPLVWTRFTTEPLPLAVQAAVERMPSSRLH